MLWKKERDRLSPKQWPHIAPTLSKFVSIHKQSEAAARVLSMCLHIHLTLNLSRENDAFPHQKLSSWFSCWAEILEKSPERAFSVLSTLKYGYYVPCFLALGPCAPSDRQLRAHLCEACCLHSCSFSASRKRKNFPSELFNSQFTVSGLVKHVNYEVTRQGGWVETR